MNKCQRLVILWQKLKDALQKLNLFKSIPPSIDEHQLRNEIISTRLFIFLLIVSLVILLFYTSVITVKKTVNIDAPSLEQYTQLYSTYSQTLMCPCSKISIDYGQILRVNYTLHQVCESIFVTQNWIDYIFNFRRQDTVDIKDFINMWIGAFQALSGFCELINQTIADSLHQFYLAQYVSASVTSSELFQSQTEAFISQFRSMTTNRFLLSLFMVRNLTQSNGILSSRLTNYKIYLKDKNSGLTYFKSSRYSNLTCYCILSARCVDKSYIYDGFNERILFSIPGIYVGCYAIESLLQSTLECFYDQICIDTLRYYLSSSVSLNPIALDSLMSSNYSVNSTINDLLQQLMIERWSSSSMYENYYNQCRPTQCIYTYETRHDALYIVTTLIGLVGGLVTVLKIFIPLVVKLVAYCIRKWKMRVAPVMTNPGT